MIFYNYKKHEIVFGTTKTQTLIASNEISPLKGEVIYRMHPLQSTQSLMLMGNTILNPSNTSKTYHIVFFSDEQWFFLTFEAFYIKKPLIMDLYLMFFSYFADFDYFFRFVYGVYLQKKVSEFLFYNE